MIYERDQSGRFRYKSDEPRKVRSVNLTDAAWQWLGDAAQSSEMSRNDFLEALSRLQYYPFIETAKQPIMETVEEPITVLMSSAELLNRLRAKHPKLKLTLKEFERILDFLYGL